MSSNNAYSSCHSHPFRFLIPTTGNSFIPDLPSLSLILSADALCREKGNLESPRRNASPNPTTWILRIMWQWHMQLHEIQRHRPPRQTSTPQPAYQLLRRPPRSRKLALMDPTMIINCP